MKIKIYALLVSLLMLMVACGKDDVKESSNTLTGITKDWKLISVNGEEPEFTVYMRFEGAEFWIYQQLYTLNYVMYDGTFSVKGDVLSGSYFDGSNWKCKYKGSISEDGEFLELVSKEKKPITSLYEACTIPESVISEATTRSVECDGYHL